MRSGSHQQQPPKYRYARPKDGAFGTRSTWDLHDLYQLCTSYNTEHLPSCLVNCEMSVLALLAVSLTTV